MAYDATLGPQSWTVNSIINPKTGKPSARYVSTLTAEGWVVSPIINPKDDVVVDLFDPANKSAAVTLSENNARMTSDTTDRGVKSIRSNSAGKRYFEVQVASADVRGTAGMANATESVNTWVGDTFNSVSIDVFNREAFSGNSSKGLTNLPVFAQGDAVGIAADFSLGKVWFSRNGVFGSGQSPDTNTGGFVIPGGALFVMVSANAGNSFRLRTVASQFTGAMPSGYTPWGAP